MRVKSIRKGQGKKYMHKVLEDEYQKNIVLPEIAREKAILEDKKAVYQKNYDIQKQRNAYSQAMAKAGQVRSRGVSSRMLE